MKKNLSIIFVFITLISTVSAFAMSAMRTPSWNDIYFKHPNMAKGWKFIVIHHSATNAGSAKAFHKYHVDQGYGGLSYHFVIGNGNGSPDGKVEIGFRWKNKVAGTHADVNSWYHNIFGIGICLVGNLEKSKPTEKQMASLIKLVKNLSKKNNIPKSNIIGHKQVPHGEVDWDHEKIIVEYKKGKFAQTNCPGRYISIDELTKKVFAK